MCCRPTSVCLYSEDRKFFLHGELYCALASAIGKGGKSFPELAARTGEEFSARQDRGSAQAADRAPLHRAGIAASAGAVDGYWASLGLPPGCRRAKSRELPRARRSDRRARARPNSAPRLSELGVRVVKRSPDLTVTLVNDYLERRLAELNQQRVSDATPWLLVQPSGAFPLVGPVFNPGDGACWTCLFDRMIRNREVKGFLDRGPARAVAVSPLARNTLGQSAIQFAALEIAKAIATGFRTELNDHIISHDLLGATIVKHYVARRPQCPTCGSKKLRDPRRAPVPIELGPGAKLVMTSGGYRTGVVARHGGALPKACQPPHRRGHAARADRSRSADEHQLPCRAQFLGAGPERRSAQGGTERRQLRQGLDRRAGRSQRADGSDRALFRDFPGRRDQGDAAVYRFRAGRRHPSQRRPAVQRRANPAPTIRRTTTSETQIAPGAVRSLGQDRVVAGLVAARRALQISSDQPVVFLLQRARRLPGRFQRLRGRQHARGSHRPGLSRTGGARCLRDLVVQPVAAGGSRPRASSTIPMSAICRPSLPKPDASCGCSTSPAISAFPPMSRSCTGCRTARKISSSAPARISTSALRCCVR